MGEYTSGSPSLGLCITGGRFGVMHNYPSGQDYSFELGTTSALKSVTALSTYYPNMTTVGAGILLGGSWRLLNKKTGVVSASLIDTPTDGSVSVSNNGNTVVIRNGTTSAGGLLYVSTDGGLLFRPTLVNLNGTGLSTSDSSAVVWVGYEWWMVSNTIAFRGKSLLEMKTATDLSNWAYAIQSNPSNPSTTVFKDDYFKTGRGIIDKVGRKHPLFSKDETSMLTATRYVVTQDHPNFVLVSGQYYNGQAPTRNAVFDLSDTPTTTHFKVPEISASKPEMQVYLAAN
jgi:hypothetical protein